MVPVMIAGGPNPVTALPHSNIPTDGGSGPDHVGDGGAAENSETASRSQCCGRCRAGSRGGECPHEIGRQRVAERVSYAGGNGGGESGAGGKTGGGRKGGNIGRRIVSNLPRHAHPARVQSKFSSRRVDGRRIHRLAEGCGDYRGVGAD